MEWETIKQAMDYGGVFAITILLMWGWFKKLDKIDDSLVKVLALLTVLIKEQTTFNHVGKILDNSKEKVTQTLEGAGAGKEVQP